MHLSRQILVALDRGHHDRHHLPLLATGSGRVLLAGENAEFVRVFLDTHPAGAPRRQRRSVERYKRA